MSKTQPASMNHTGYGTLPPDEQWVIRRLLGKVDTPGNRDRLADLMDSAGSDPFVINMINSGNQVILTLELEDDTFTAIPISAYVAAIREYVREVQHG
jgi:hypothetical protein